MILHRLSGGAASPVMVVDFAPFSDAAPLSHVLAGLAPERAVYQADPVTILAAWQRYADLEDLAAGSAADFLAAEPGTGPAVVVGYCSAAALSLRIAQLLEGSRPVTVVLARPTWPDEEQVRARFAGLLATLGAAGRPCPDLDGDPERVVRRMAHELRAGLAAIAGEAGLDDPAGPFAELLARYRAWLAFLLACRNDSAASGKAESAKPAAEHGDDGPRRPGSATVSVVPGPSPERDGTMAELAGLILSRIGPANLSARAYPVFPAADGRRKHRIAQRPSSGE